MHHFVIDILVAEHPEAQSKYLLVLDLLAQNNYPLKAKHNCELLNDDNVLDGNNHCHDSDDSDGSYDGSRHGNSNHDDHSHRSLHSIHKQ